MEQKNINLLIAGFVFLIVGIVLLSPVASNTNDVIDKDVVSDETTNLSVSCYVAGEVNESVSACNLTITNAPSGWKVAECPLTSVTATNATGTALTLATDYNFFESGSIIQMLNTTDTNATGLGEDVILGYTFCPDDYLNSTWGRSVLATVPGFFALALLGVALWMFYAVFRNVGLMSSNGRD